ncbi:hypothetical protein SAMN05421736_101581 [Evansella caseinilytica]|uniref:Uncharacterized protein n=1 Tax=Evansella caseinilytica TaxID=1503961 RepID=A0A1H3HQH0_9BACI|nr:hypothetical protein SAMN05421736_101581 [Evansella caseinilytica]
MDVASLITQSIKCSGMKERFYRGGLFIALAQVRALGPAAALSFIDRSDALPI